MSNYWQRDNLHNIIPRGPWGEYPEGFNPAKILRELVDGIEFESIIDFGCGYGRLCEVWDPDKYIGVDTNVFAIAEARRRHPDYCFLHNTKPPAHIYLAYTVFLHLTDDEIKAELEGIDTIFFIIAEIMGKEWANNGKHGTNPPTYNRDSYWPIMEEFDYTCISTIKQPYERYISTSIAIGKNTDISFQLWRKI